MLVNDLKSRVRNIIIQLLDVGCTDEDFEQFWKDCIKEAKEEYKININ